MLKLISRIFLTLFLLLFLAFISIKWIMDHEIASVTPLSMSTIEVNLNPVVDKNHIFKNLPENNEPQHPFMAKTDRSAMHAGSWESDVHPASAVSSKNIKIISRRAGGSAARQCATFTFIEQGHPLILCGGLTSFRLQLLDKDTLELLAKYDLPMRPSTFESIVKRDTDIIFTDTSGGAGVTQAAGTDADSDAYIEPKVDKYSGDLMYIENRAAVTRAADQTEDIKVIIEI